MTVQPTADTAFPTPAVAAQDFNPSHAMSPLARRLLIIAAIDGLILQPLQNSRSRTPPTSPGAGGVKLEYKTNKIVPYTAGKQLGPKEEGSSVEAHGIVGRTAKGAFIFADLELTSEFHGS